MKNLLASFFLAAAAAIVLSTLAAAPAPLVQRFPARVDRLLPHAALLRFEGGAFTVVPRSALRADVLPGDAVDLRLLPLGERRLAAMPAPLSAERAELAARTW